MKQTDNSEHPHNDVHSPRRSRSCSTELLRMESGSFTRSDLHITNDDDTQQITSLKQLRRLLRQSTIAQAHTDSSNSHRNKCASSPRALQLHNDHQKKNDDGSNKNNGGQGDALYRTLVSSSCSTTKTLWIFLSLLLLLFVFDWSVERLLTQYCGLLSGEHTATSIQETHNACSPAEIDMSKASYLSTHRFYDLLQRRSTNGQPSPLPQPPVFHGALQVLCHPQARQQSQFGYCLPIGGRKDEPFCSRADRMDLLIPQVHTNANSTVSYCYASVLHMLLVDVYHELRAIHGAAPIIAYGTLLGAVRNQTMIAYTEDADLAYNFLSSSEMKRLQNKLWAKGYHMFHFLLWRVCVAPTHPLASVLFDPHRGLVKDYSVPYVDLYEMKQVSATHWRISGTADEDRLVPHDKALPYKTVQINGLDYDTLADPVDFLLEEYGEDYLVPWQRPEKRPPKAFQFFDEQESSHHAEIDRGKEEEGTE